MRARKHILGRFLAYLLLCATVVTVLSSCGVKAADIDNTLKPMEASDKNMATESIINPDTEIRAVWIASVFNIDYPTKADLTATQLQSELDEIIATCEKNKLNTIFFQVRPTCDALYKSEIFPVSSYLSTSSTLSFDPLAYLVKAAHEKNIFVHAWVNPLRVTMNSTDVNTLPANSPARLHPEWTVPFADGKLYLNAGLPEVRQLVADGVREIVANYDVDGIVFDDYFYPTTDESIDAAQFAASGAGNLAAWRRENVTALVRAVHDTVKAADPTLRFGISPQGNPDNDENQQYSDVTGWLASGGGDAVVDYLCPQVYWGQGFALHNGSTRFAFENIVPAWLAYPRAADVALYFGLGAYRVGVGDGGSNENSLSGWSTGRALADQVAFLREQGAGGWALYRYGSLFGPEQTSLAAAECGALAAADGKETA